MLLHNSGVNVNVDGDSITKQFKTKKEITFLSKDCNMTQFSGLSYV